MQTIDIIPHKAGVYIEKGFRGTPWTGILNEYKLKLPGFRQGVYFDAVNDRWPTAANRVRPIPIHCFRECGEGGLFCVLNLEDDTQNGKKGAGSFLALLSLAGTKTISWFIGKEEEMVIRVGTLGTDYIEADLPVLSWYRGRDIYECCRKVWELALRHLLLRGPTSPRETKNYPAIFNYLGWCTWEEYKFDIDEATIGDAVDLIEKSHVPVRYLLIDAGHNDISTDKGPYKGLLMGHGPDKVKFPLDWRNIISRKQEDKIKWMGIWLNFRGYWNGIHPENRLRIDEHLMKTTTKAVLPRNNYLSSYAFYKPMIEERKKAGFDFVKIDGQADLLGLYQGTGNPVECMVNNHTALEAVCGLYMHGLMNCMAHGPTCLFNSTKSAVTRCSEDYKVGDLGRAKLHIHNSYMNTLWLGQTVWVDHDMYHSSDTVAGQMMAISKAMSGGPTYLSDNPVDFKPENILPLCFSDGKLLRPLAPAVPLPESVWMDPYKADPGQPFRVIAPLENHSVAITCYNLTTPTIPVTGTISIKDYQWANAMVGPAGARPCLSREGLVVYNWKTGFAEILRNASDETRFTIEGFADTLYLLCPINHGWAIIGRCDKYLSPAAVKVIDVSKEEVVLKMVESGPLLVWNKVARNKGGTISCVKPVDASGVTLVTAYPGLLQCDIPVGRKDEIVRLRRETG